MRSFAAIVKPDLTLASWSSKNQNFKYAPPSPKQKFDEWTVASHVERAAVNAKKTAPQTQPAK